MQLSRKLPLLVSLGLVAAVVGGAQTAAAKTVVLCEVHEHRCSRSHSHHGLTSIAEKNKEKGLEPIDLGSVRCETSQLKSGGEPGAEKVESWTFGECSSGCEVKTTGLPYGVGLKTTNEESGTMTVTPTISTLCAGTKCVYAASVPIEVKGGKPAILKVGTSLSKVEGGAFCSSSATLAGNYEVTVPGAVYVTYRTEPPAAGGTLLCESTKEPCPEEQVRGLDFLASLEPKAKASFDIYMFGALPCTEATLSVESEESTGEGKPPLLGKAYAFSFGGCALCKVEFNPPFVASLQATGSGNGTLLLSGSEKGDLTATAPPCGALPKCVYKVKAIALKFIGGEPAKVPAEFEMPLVEGPPSTCKAIALIKANFQVVEPATPLFAR